MNNVNGLVLDYTQAMMTGLFFIPTIKTATVMGLGAGSMVKNLLSSFSKINVHAIEYREAVAKIAKKYFHLPDNDRLTLHIDDAANYMKDNPMKSDIIFSDLYNSKGMEVKQVQSSYLRDCKNSLTENGVLILNIWHTALASHEDLNELLSLEFENKFLSKGKYLEEKMNIPLERYAKLLWSTEKYKFSHK